MALLLRLAFVEVHSHTNDVQAFAGWAIQLRYTPPWEFHSFAGYPPGYSVVPLAIGRLYGLITAYLPDPGGLLLRAMLKFPPIVMDVVNAWLVWGIARCVAPRLALTAAMVWLFNPVAWIDSTLWGQIDSVCWGFALAALLMLLLGTREPAKTVPRFAWAWPLLAVSFLVKPVALPMLPAFVSYALFARGGTLQRRLAGSGAGIMAAALLCWGIASLFSGILNPFEAARTWIGYLGVHSMVGVSGGSYTSVNAFNIWSVIMPFYLPDTIRLGGVSLAQIGFGLALLAIVAIVAWMMWAYVRPRALQPAAENG